ncbi:hypothetical protein, partial [Klebsiella pneumoniae]|uniref:hypothetical protein n=1 Tax=Klebsiella pneumoniae TaxID=573 RepID=UPI0025A1A5C0
MFDVNESNPYLTPHVPSSNKSAQSEFRRNVFWYGVGIWTLGVFTAILGTIFTTEPDRFETPIGIAVMAFFA